MTARPPFSRTDSDKDSGIRDPLTLSGFRSLRRRDSLTNGDTVELAMLEGQETTPDAEKKESGESDTTRNDGHLSGENVNGTLLERNAVEYEETHPWQKITINVSGTIIETYYEVIDRFPKTLLGDPGRRKRYWDDERQEFYFDTHAASFEGIFEWYQTKVLKKPSFVPMETFLEQLQFFDVDTEAQLEFRKSEGFLMEEEKDPVLPKGKCARFVWKVFEYPHSSVIARIVGVVSIVFVFLSLCVLCVETLPSQQGKDCINVTSVDEESLHVRRKPNFGNTLFFMESACTAWFVFEYAMRFAFCPQKKEFLLGLFNALDLLTILPYFILLAAMLISQDCKLGTLKSLVPILRILRAFRVFKLSRHSRSLQVLCLTLKSSLHELAVSAMFLCFGATLSAFVIYVAEEGERDSQINSVAEGVWWAVATMTTVGYGDIVPVGVWGKLVGATCVILGALVLALPAPIIVTNFNKIYKPQPGR